MVAGYASMAALDRTAFDRLDRLGDTLREKLAAIAGKHDAPFTVTGAASLFRIHPKRRAPTDYRDAAMSPAQSALMKALSRAYSEAGIILPNAAAACLSTPMTEKDINGIADVFDDFIVRRSDLIEGLAA
jgi:glutamate-1-semialdehyde 2,1-aminomutase